MKWFKRIILAILVLLIGAIIAASVYIGDYFVDFAFQRSLDPADKGMPKAASLIVSMDAQPCARPDYPSEIITITVNNGEKRNATLFISDADSHRYAILVHGYCRHQGYTWDYAVPYLKEEYNVLTPDLNASGTSDGVYVTMGCVESDDLVAWANELVRRDPQAKIVLHGVSMGAATVMMATAKELPPNVVAAVEDCGYTSAYDLFAGKLNDIYSLPSFPFMNIIDLANRVKTGYFITDASPLKAVPDTKIPMLFIHGDKDTLVPIRMEDELYLASGAPVKKKIVVEGAAHADSFHIDASGYFQQIFEFLDSVASNYWQK